MPDAPPIQAVVTAVEDLDDDRQIQRIALFNPDGTPYTGAGVGTGGVTVHGDLDGRTEPDQHPISAITGLAAALAAATSDGVSEEYVNGAIAAHDHTDNAHGGIYPEVLFEQDFRALELGVHDASNIRGIGEFNPLVPNDVDYSAPCIGDRGKLAVLFGLNDAQEMWVEDSDTGRVASTRLGQPHTLCGALGILGVGAFADTDGVFVTGFLGGTLGSGSFSDNVKHAEAHIELADPTGLALNVQMRRHRGGGSDNIEFQLFESVEPGATNPLGASVVVSLVDHPGIDRAAITLRHVGNMAYVLLWGRVLFSRPTFNVPETWNNAGCLLRADYPSTDCRLSWRGWNVTKQAPRLQLGPVTEAGDVVTTPSISVFQSRQPLVAHIESPAPTSTYTFGSTGGVTVPIAARSVTITTPQIIVGQLTFDWAWAVAHGPESAIECQVSMIAQYKVNGTPVGAAVIDDIMVINSIGGTIARTEHFSVPVELGAGANTITIDITSGVVTLSGTTVSGGVLRLRGGDSTSVINFLGYY